MQINTSLVVNYIFAKVVLEDVRQMHAEPLTEVCMAQVLRGYQTDAPLGMSQILSSISFL
jgi:hypothetical protein